jgi:hypothetical protein
MNRELRMYGLVPYNISPIQQGIQFGHAVVEYGLQHSTEEYTDWAKNWKTFIILNGGTTNDRIIDGEYVGSLNQHMETLMKAGVRISVFREPDLGDQLTAVVFIVDERVFNRKMYPEYNDLVRDWSEAGGADHLPSYDSWVESFSEDPIERERILFLRNFLKNFRLA